MAGSIKAGVMEILGTHKTLAGNSMEERVTTAGTTAVRAKINCGVLPSIAWTAKVWRNPIPTMVISPRGCIGEQHSLDTSGARIPGGRRSSKELKSTKEG